MTSFFRNLEELKHKKKNWTKLSLNSFQRHYFTSDCLSGACDELNTALWTHIVGIATGYGLDGPGIEFRWGAKFSTPVQTGPGAHPASCTMGTVSFPRVKSGRGVTLTPHPLLVPWSRKGRAIPLLSLWAVRPVQSLSACTRVHFTFFYLWTRMAE